MSFIDNLPSRDQFYEQFAMWAERQPAVRAAILSSTLAVMPSTLAVPGAAADVFSDYDIILILTDVHPFHDERAWLEDFGPVLAIYHDPLGETDSFPTSGYVTQYESGLKIDFTLWPVEYLEFLTRQPALPQELDAGYRVLVDKDGLAARLKPPAYRAYIPTPPGEAEYQMQIDQCFLVALYVAKYLWRGDLMAAKHHLVTFLHDEHMRPMLEWHMENDHGWAVKAGPYGRGLQKWLRPDLWADLMGTYTGAGLEESWEALFKSLGLMRKTALEVGERLGFAYPEAKERRTLEMIEQMKNHPRERGE